MTSLQAKNRLMNWVNSWGNEYTGGVYEAANLANADFIAVKYNGKITEFEIKVNKADLRGEIAAIRAALLPGTMEQVELWGKTRQRVRKDIKLSHTKIEKHRHYLVEHRKQEYTDHILFYPNLFYFAVPHELVDYALECITGLPYGVFNLDSMHFMKIAKSIRTEPHDAGVYKDLFNRACTQRMDVQRSVRSQNYRLIERIAEANNLLIGTPGRMRLEAVLKQHNTAEGLDGAGIPDLDAKSNVA